MAIDMLDRERLVAELEADRMEHRTLVSFSSRPRSTCGRG